MIPQSHGFLYLMLHGMHGQALGSPVPQLPPLHSIDPSSTFADPASDVAYGPGDKPVDGYQTPPTSDGGCLFNLIEAYFADKTLFPNGPDLPNAPACHKFIQLRVVQDFNLQPGSPAYNSAIVNTSGARFSQGVMAAGYHNDGSLASLGWRVNSDGTHPFLLPDTMVLAGTGINGAPATEVNADLIAKWTNAPGGPYVPRVRQPQSYFA